ncbi:MAG: DNA adenine methylase, partial [Acholeplasmataceae bacterium]
MTLDISYKKYKSSSDIHGTILYPAPMIAPMQTDVLKLLINKDKQTTIMDPFNGSGVVLYEALSNFDNIVAFGMDINPYAIMISKVKLQGVEDSIEVDINRLEQLLNISEEVVVEHSFENINKWFRKDIILSFSKIRSSIMKIENTKNRMFFWVIFSNIIRKYSN